MRLQRTSLDANNTRDRCRRAYVQLVHERELLITRMEREILSTGSALQFLSRRLGFMRLNPRGNRHSMNSLGELQGNMAAINTIAGAIQMCDSMLELLEDVLNIPQQERHRPA